MAPHDAHVLWLRELLPSKGLPIWIRWEKPYECQHLGNVETLNFGKQPDWEPMWAIDHRSKRIVEVEGYSSVDLRAALWASGAALRGFVLAENSKLLEPMSLPASDDQGLVPWSPWRYPRQHVNYLEIGTSDFDTLLDRHIWRSEVVGFSVEPVKTYFDRLPSHGGRNKMLLNVAVSDYDGYEDVFLVRPDLVGSHLQSGETCKQELLAEVGLTQCLPGWMRGTSSIKRPPQGVLQLLGEERMRSVLAVTRVPCLTYATLVTVYGIGSIDILKVDAEGFDHNILRQVIDFGEKQGMWPGQVQFEKNSISDWQDLDRQVARLQNHFGYSCRMTGAETASCWRTGGTRRADER
eukprot:TRINITY_DN22498_c0_g1_i1.p1 TRINITY_DN22498_c0_g1~~TRINITY_DN22498_c0_g1_i1.p1  ORF type:complete len:377 (-),score=47.18 TRINITY_DN22498_c0_g1_i1:181-1233(-)